MVLISILIIGNNIITGAFKVSMITNTLLLIIPLTIFLYALKEKIVVAKLPIIQYLTISILFAIFTYEHIYKINAGTNLFKILLACINCFCSLLVINYFKRLQSPIKIFKYSDNYTIKELSNIYKSNLYKIVEDENYLSYYDKNIKKLFTNKNELENFIIYCKEHEVDFLHMTKEDFSVYNMMCI